MKHLGTLCIVFILCITWGCKKDDPPARPHNVFRDRIINCYTARKLDSIKLAAELIGTWKYSWTGYYDEATSSYNSWYAGAFEYQLNADGTYRSLEGVVYLGGIWRLIYEGNNYKLLMSNMNLTPVQLCGDTLILDHKGEAEFNVYHKVR